MGITLKSSEHQFRIKNQTTSQGAKIFLGVYELRVLVIYMFYLCVYVCFVTSTLYEIHSDMCRRNLWFWSTTGTWVIEYRHR